MNKKKSNLARLYLATASMIASTALSASAFTMNSGKVSNLTAQDINKSFTIRFDGTVQQKDVLGLSSEANLKLTRFTTSHQETRAAFDVLLKNTSSNGIKSRVSIFGFNTDSMLKNAYSEGIFGTTILDGSLPYHLGNADICFNSGSNTHNCKYSSGGVKNQHSELFSLEMIFDPQVTKLELTDFIVRYQNIKGLNYGHKGIGLGVTTEVPEPSNNEFLALLTISSLGWLAKKIRE